mmetsp:Transcript_17086/g.47333  ORF Transcript_17086/g.47333 Transcript_17086/m.47333 type:complete len:248 (+) Transcript_17086:4134-4877(+)
MQFSRTPPRARRAWASIPSSSTSRSAHHAAAPPCCNALSAPGGAAPRTGGCPAAAASFAPSRPSWLPCCCPCWRAISLGVLTAICPPTLPCKPVSWLSCCCPWCSCSSASKDGGGCAGRASAAAAVSLPALLLLQDCLPGCCEPPCPAAESLTALLPPLPLLPTSPGPDLPIDAEGGRGALRGKCRGATATPAASSKAPTKSSRRLIWSAHPSLPLLLLVAQPALMAEGLVAACEALPVVLPEEENW